MTKRIGFACKWIDHPTQIDGIKPKDDCKKYNTGSTTVAWLNRQTKDAATQKLWDIMVKNIESVRLLIEKVGSLDGHLRMVRLSSDLLPVYTEPTWCWFWRIQPAKNRFRRALNPRLHGKWRDQSAYAMYLSGDGAMRERTG